MIASEDDDVPSFDVRIIKDFEQEMVISWVGKKGKGIFCRQDLEPDTVFLRFLGNLSEKDPGDSRSFQTKTATGQEIFVVASEYSKFSFLHFFYF